MDCAKELLFGPGNARLPLPPMLMIDRITHISDEGGEYGKGEIIAELDIKKNKTLKNGKIKFTGQVTPSTKLITYHLHIKRVIKSKLTMGIADATLKADDKIIYTGQDLRVGLFTDLAEVDA